MKPSVYIETSVVSYLTSRPSRDLVVAGHQQITREWWERILPIIRPVISEFVIDESSMGDSGSAALRLGSIDGFKVLEVNSEIETLAEKYFSAINIPERSRIDASHLAVAAWHGVDYVLSWNCKHIASARVQRILEDLNRELAIITPTVCTPEELMEV